MRIKQRNDTNNQNSTQTNITIIILKLLFRVIIGRQTINDKIKGLSTN